MTEQGVLSEDEGVSAIYIKKLSHTIRDGDPIRAVNRSICVATDGKTAGFTLPNPESHEKLMRGASLVQYP
ncbi:hypothetical protein N657DRAFT_681931 [Parathielavia appendiculata]|uniref:Uncharacterized protein n=1 Tax=Parathielavia appendiculata TaxID=2587402 RepID=A0AAN6TWQ6_9PEZI|nr:hypothetical protein N657DRAFT_681931 [Parathielavia appendiculata]